MTVGLSLDEQVTVALKRTIGYLLDQQRPDGSWAGVLSSSALATATSVMMLHFMDRTRFMPRVACGTAWLIQTQHNDGGWGDAVHDESTINATSLALAALHFVDAEQFALPIKRGLAWLQRWGGFEAVCDMRHCTLSGVCRTISALAGLVSWSRLKDLPLEITLAPRGLRRKISITLPAFLALAILQEHQKPSQGLKRFMRHLSISRALAWLKRAQAPNGSYEESALLTSLVVLGLAAAGLDNVPIIAPGVRYVLETQRPDGSWPIDRDLETFDTSLTVLGLSQAGLDLGEECFQRARDWLLKAQMNSSFFPTGAPGGGWGWARPGGWPEADDTAHALKALCALRVPSHHPQVQQGVHWLLKMRNRDGSWATFVRNSSLPFDQPCPYITAHVLSALRDTGLFGVQSPVVRRALAYLERAQESDGAFPAVWFRNYTCGTAFVLQTLAEYGLAHSPMSRRAIAWLYRNQNPEGGWGRCKGQESTAEETAWAVTALLAVGESVREQAIQEGVQWLIARQFPDGTWSPSPVGLYFNCLCYANSYYALVFPLDALARFHRKVVSHEADRT